MYVERWLKSKAVLEDGTEVNRDKGTPQGGVISPLLANLFLHYAFDMWINRKFPEVPFERYADDIIVHCKTKTEAESLKMEIGKRLSECKLELHPEKTKIVYCNNGKGGGRGEIGEFDFLGYTFKPRKVRFKDGKTATGFLPAISKRASKSIRDEIRSWHIGNRTTQTLEDMAEYINRKLRGWANYYGKYYKSELYFSFEFLNFILARWAMNKFKKMKGKIWKAVHFIGKIAKEQPTLFYHWEMGLTPATE